jgi:DNA-binding Lrp family transcriptional regulator
MYTIDAIDFRILKILSQNSSMSITSIAKKSQIARGTVAYRIECMEKEKIILKYKTIIDYAKLGLNYGRIAIKLVNNSQLEHEKFAKELNYNKKIAWFASTEGKYDLIASALYLSNSDFEKIIRALKDTHGNNIADLRISIMNRLHICGNNFISKDPFYESLKIDYSAKIEETDELDKKIVEALSKDTKYNISKICLELKVSPKTFISRKKWMEQQKIILGYSIEINKEYFNLSTYQIFCDFNMFDNTMIKKFHQHILGLNEVEYVSEAIGSSDYEFYISTKDDKQLYVLLNQIREKFPSLIKSFEHILVLNERKLF